VHERDERLPGTPVDELAEQVHPVRTAEDEHSTEILVLRLAPDQVPQTYLLTVLRSHRGESGVPM
jgi:hypothetical protein